jgi:hypothetical protein
LLPPAVGRNDYHRHGAHVVQSDDLAQRFGHGIKLPDPVRALS